eukprot:jgi/Tetstr1/443728/TSEL_003258.t1
MEEPDALVRALIMGFPRNAVLCTSIPNNELCAALGGCVDRNLAVWIFRAVAAYLCTSMPLEFLFSQSAAQSSGATFYFGPSTSTMTLPCGADVNVELYIINRKWSAGPADVPLLAAGQEVDLSGLRVFSCPAYVHLDRTLRRKADVAAWKGIYVAWFFPPTTPSNVSSHAVADSSSSDGADNAAVDVRQLPPLPSSPPLRRSTRIRFSTTDDSYVYYGTTKSSCPAAPAAVVDSVSLPSTLSQHDIPTNMYAPVVSFVSIRILLALAVHLRRRIYNMDVTTAFLNAKLLQSTCVDDIIILEAADPAWYPAFKTRLLAEFDCTDAGLCTWLMGMGLDWDDDDGSVILHQTKYIHDVLATFGMTDCNPQSLPCRVDTRLSATAGTLLPTDQVSLYKQLQDFMYLCISTLHKYGLPVKLAKNEWAFTRCEFVGVLIDTVRGTVAVYVARCEKLRARADDLLAEIDISGHDPPPAQRPPTPLGGLGGVRGHYIGRLLTGVRLTGSNVLFRLDNTSSRSDTELIAHHISGREISLADCLTRLRGVIDDKGWRLLVAFFREMEAACGPFDVDACSDPLGRISFCRAFWSAIDSCLAHDWAGRRVYCTPPPPCAAVRDILRHFWACYATAQSTTTACTFMLPV